MMKKSISTTLIILFLTGFIAWFVIGCGNSNEKIAAVVNGTVITVADVDGRLERLTDQAKRALGNNKARLLEEMIMETVLLQEAEKQGVPSEAEVNQLIDEAKRQIYLGRLLEKLRDEQAVDVSDEQLRQLYEQNLDRFVEPETFRASHILTDNEADAQDALRRVKDGEKFEDVAAAVSVDPTRQRGGDIGTFRSGQVIPEFEEACSALKIGEVSDVVKTPLGYHVILLTEHKAARQLDFAEVSDKLKEQQEVQAKQRNLEKVLQDLRQSAQVQIREPSLAPATEAQQPAAPQS